VFLACTSLRARHN